MTAGTCRRGHERNAENTRERDHHGRLILECRACARITAAARKAARAASQETAHTEAPADA